MCLEQIVIDNIKYFIIVMLYQDQQLQTSFVMVPLLPQFICVYSCRGCQEGKCSMV